MAFKNMSGKKGWDTDCHGQTFTNGEYWINNDDVRNLLKGVNYKKENEQDSKTADKVVYANQDGEVQDSRTITRTNAPDGTCVYGQGGLEENNYESQIDQTWTAPGTKKEIYRKTDPNKKATKDEINKLITTALDDLKKQQEKEQKKDNNKQ